MSDVAPWLALATDWMDSDMFDDATDGERLVWILLLCHAKAHGRAGRVALRKNALLKRWNVSERAYDGMLKRAQKCGALSIDGDSVTLCNWRAYQNKAYKGKYGDSPETRETSENSPTQSPSHPVTQIPITPKENTLVASPKPATATRVRSADVEAIYQAYPRKVGKRRALEAITRACRIRDPAWLLTRVVAYAATPAGNAGTFTPHPATWFNAGKYDDDPAEWQRDRTKSAANGYTPRPINIAAIEAGCAIPQE